MRKHLGATTRRRPNFDSLENRSLLSGFHSMPGLPEGPAFLAVAMFRSDRGGLAGPGFSSGPSTLAGPVFQPAQPWPWHEGSGAPFQDQGGPPNPIGGNPTFEQSVPSPVQSDAQQNVSAEPTAAPAASSFVSGPPRNQSGTVASAPTEVDQLFASVDASAGDAGGAAAVAGKDSGQAAGGAGFGPVGPATTAPPAQIASLVTADVSLIARLTANGDASTGGNRIGAAGLYRTSTGKTSQPVSALMGRAAWNSASGDSSRLTGDKPDELPIPTSADLIANVLPFDRAALDRAISSVLRAVRRRESAGPARQKSDEDRPGVAGRRQQLHGARDGLADDGGGWSGRSDFRIAITWTGNRSWDFPNCPEAGPRGRHEQRSTG